MEIGVDSSERPYTTAGKKPASRMLLGVLNISRLVTAKSIARTIYRSFKAFAIEFPSELDKYYQICYHKGRLHLQPSTTKPAPIFQCEESHMQEEFAYIVSFTSPSNGTESFQFDLQTTVPIQVGETFWPRTGLC